MDRLGTCPTLDAFFEQVVQLGNKRKLAPAVKDRLRRLKIELRFMRIIMKWTMTWGKTTAFHGIFDDIETAIQPAKMQLSNRVIRDLSDVLAGLSTRFKPVKERIKCYCMHYLQRHQDTPMCSSAYSLTNQFLVDLLDPLLKNLKHLLSRSDDILSLLKEEIKSLEEILRFVRNFLEFVSEKQHKLKTGPKDLYFRLEDLLACIEVLIENAAILSYLCWLEDSKAPSHLKIRVSDFLLKIKHILPRIRMMYVDALKATKTANPGALAIDIRVLVTVVSLLDKLEELQILKDGSIFPIEPKISSVHKQLNFLRNFLMDPPPKRLMEPVILNSLLEEVEAVDRTAGPIIHSFCISHMKDYKKITFLLSDLQEKMNPFKAKIGELYHKVPKPSPPKFLRMQRLSFIDYIFHKLDDLPKSYTADSIASVKNEIQEVKDLLKHSRSSFGDTAEQWRTEELDSVQQGVLNVAYEAENVIDLIAAGSFPVWYYVLWISDVIKKFKLLIETEIPKIREEEMSDTGVPNIEEASFHECCPVRYCMLCISDVIRRFRLRIQTQIPNVHEEEMSDAGVPNIVEDSYHECSPDNPKSEDNAPYEEVVGFQDQAEKIKDRLIGGSTKLEIVSIVGLPGLGKTTLAKKLYEDPSINLYFHVRSWCVVSQVCERRQLLLDILKNIIVLEDQTLGMDDRDLGGLLYRSLKGRKYLIVMDDIWNVKTWNDLKPYFPEDGNRSRILFTSRVHDVAMLAKPDSAPHFLRLFSEEESWELLQKKVFQQGSCPVELSNVGMQIAKNCEGLPLAVVVIAGVLKRTDKNQDKWRQISESQGKNVVGDTRNCMNVLELSYNHLPDHLKICFLYLGCFPQDKEILARKLVRLWVAEGFVQESEGKSLEDEAESYLMDLIGRSLVMVTKKNCKGGVKACRIHDLLHEFCIAKAEQENFLQLMHDKGNHLPYVFEGNADSHNFNPSILEQQRLFIHCKRKEFVWWRPSNTHVRSLLYFAATEKESTSPHHCDFSFVSYCMKLLRVLDLGSINMGNKFPKGIELLVHLRYLAVRGEIDHIPSSIGVLRRLETFLFKGLRGEVKLPSTLWQMDRLKHVCIDDRAALQLSIGGPGNNIEFKLDDIETLSTPALCYGDDNIEIMRRLKSLRKLKCIFLDSWDYSRCCNRFPVLDFLSKLESLKVVYHGKVQHPSEFNFPSNLKKLTLSKFRLPWTEISKIGRLRHLEALKLLFKAFEGTQWIVSDEEFCSLKFLKLDSLNIAQWNASDNAFPQLRHLVLQRCKELEEFPCLGEISTLQTIEVHWCSDRAAKLAMEIQEELGNDGVKVIIHPPDLGSTSAS